MEKRDTPTLIDRIGTPLFFLMGGASAIIWFIYRVFSLFQNASSQMIIFDKGSYYMLGVGVGLLSLGYMIVSEFWFGRPLTSRQSSFFSGLAISGIVLVFVVPHMAHYVADKYLKKNGYSVCEEASHQWLFIRDIVYIAGSVECSSSLKEK